MATFGFELRHLGLLVRGEHLVDGRFGLGVRQGLLRGQRTDAVGRRFHCGCVIRVNGVLQVCVRGFHAGVNRGAIGFGAGEDVGHLGLLRGSERQHGGQVADAVLNHVRGAAWVIGRGCGGRVVILCKHRRRAEYTSE